ncbi:histidine phosphatase family protein [Virgibacillus profundi]|uniref:Histidine phosphatase family protein n=1 Tax=Virgibacillus profundi TaxID=2024555 RepID=A0A2A2IGV8_9BACI|nr:histidine phosphatase family protein [Virgibacillus profundi]PAV30877.1 histidine phosphatase family protein [Virgibacillus profundi]PXY55060.1 histidine phosphatase family protein [Virgibacillus profundi]
METTIYMIRHAKSPFVFGQERTRKLSLQGETDSKKVADLMSQKEIDVIVSSPYIRAIQTIEDIAEDKDLEIKIFEELKERQLKGAYKLPEEEIQQAIKKSYEDIDYYLSGGESIRDVQNRSLPVIKNLLTKYEGKTIIIGTHGNIMTIIMNYFNSGYGYDFWKSTTKPDIYKLIFLNQELQDVQRIWE